MRDIATDWGLFRDHDDTAVGRTLAEGRFWDAHLKPFMDEVHHGVAIDVGAYIGFHTCYLAGLYSRVYAFEPNLRNTALLVHNIVENVPAPHNVVVGSWAGYSHDITLRSAILSEVGWDPTHPSNQPGVPYLPGGPLVGRRLDRLIPLEEPVTFIKIDAQGCDLRVLYGLQEIIARWRPLIVFEWEAGFVGWHGDRWELVDAWAAPLRYDVERITPHYWDYVARPR